MDTLDTRVTALENKFQNLATKDDLKSTVQKVDDKIEARFQSLHTLIFRYLLTDNQREDWNRRKNGFA